MTVAGGRPAKEKESISADFRDSLFDLASPAKTHWNVHSRGSHTGNSVPCGNRRRGESGVSFPLDPFERERFGLEARGTRPAREFWAATDEPGTKSPGTGRARLRAS